MTALHKILPTLALLTTTTAFATPITGTVTNGTTKKPSAGDTVTLIRLAQGMQEANHTTTDAKGRYTLDVADAGIHLIRVTHDKANYFQPAPPGTATVDIDVYNAAAKVKGVAEEADVMRIQTDAAGTGLQVVENIFVKNDSAPPMTQFSAVPFDFWLPEGAVIGGSAALAPGGMPVQAAPVPLAEKNHYTFLFPIRPGETRFQISYHLAYTGKFTFTPHPTGPVDTIAVMFPKSMTFTGVTGSIFSAVNDEVNAQTYVARNATSNEPLGFTLSGTGQLPRDANAPNAGDNQQAATQQAPDGGSGQTVPETQNNMPGRGLQNPLDPEGTRDPWSKYKYWILGGLAALLAIVAGILLRKPTTPPSPIHTPTTTPPQTHHNILLNALKEELFALETDRLQNRITESDYLEQKAAIETVLRRALNRNSAVVAENMTTILRILRLFALSTWVGSLVFFGLTAKAAFATLTPPQAGIMVRTTLISLHHLGLAAGGIFFLLTIALLATQGDSHPARAAELALIVAMLALTAYSQYSILPRIDAAQATGELQTFDHLHKLSVRVEGAILVESLLLLILAPIHGRDEFDRFNS